MRPESPRFYTKHADGRSMKPPQKPRLGASPAWTRAVFLLAAHRLDQLPPDEGAEVAFAGRSNAGKSSAINALTGQAGLARISKTPGRTQQLVVFTLDARRRLVDLPGYGYAEVPDALRAHWGGTLARYFRERACLRGLLIAMDIRHPLRDYDLMMLDLAASRGLPVHVLLTKADKLGRGQGSQALAAVRRALAGRPGDVSVQLFSSVTGDGVPAARGVVAGWLAARDDMPPLDAD
jgi:GTP-binding protein